MKSPANSIDSNKSPSNPMKKSPFFVSFPIAWLRRGGFTWTDAGQDWENSNFGAPQITAEKKPFLDEPNYYPLVNIQKTIENHHAINGKIHYFDWVIFNSYVKLPEGISHDLKCI